MIEDEKCGFKDCLHIGEPGCVVKGDWERYPYYLQLLDEIRIREEFQLRTFGTKREGDVRYCSILLKKSFIYKIGHTANKYGLNRGVLDTGTRWEAWV